VTEKTAENRPFLYIFINVMIFIYIQPHENKMRAYDGEGWGDIYRDIFSPFP
jgi:hypothetical protein